MHPPDAQASEAKLRCVCLLKSDSASRPQSVSGSPYLKKVCPRVHGPSSTSCLLTGPANVCRNGNPSSCLLTPKVTLPQPQKLLSGLLPLPKAQVPEAKRPVPQNHGPKTSVAAENCLRRIPSFGKQRESYFRVFLTSQLGMVLALQWSAQVFSHNQ